MRTGRVVRHRSGAFRGPARRQATAFRAHLRGAEAYTAVRRLPAQRPEGRKGRMRPLVIQRLVAKWRRCWVLTDTAWAVD